MKNSGSNRERLGQDRINSEGDSPLAAEAKWHPQKENRMEPDDDAIQLSRKTKYILLQ